VTSTELSPARKSPQATSRHIHADERFSDILSEEFGFDVATVLQALEGELRKRAITIFEWASRQEDAEGALLCWDSKHCKGHCRRSQRAGRPSRRHAGISSRPTYKQDCPGRRSGTLRHEDGCSLRGILVDADTLDRIANGSIPQNTPNEPRGSVQGSHVYHVEVASEHKGATGMSASSGTSIRTSDAYRATSLAHPQERAHHNNPPEMAQGCMTMVLGRVRSSPTKYCSLHCNAACGQDSPETTKVRVCGPRRSSGGRI
jgi:hypothetical protein